MSSKSPPQQQQQQQQSGGSQSTSPFRSLLESPSSLLTTTKQRSPRTPTYSSLASSPQPPPRPSSVLPSILAALSPPTSTSNTPGITIKHDRSASPANSNTSTSPALQRSEAEAAVTPCPPNSPPSPAHSGSGHGSATSAAAPQQFCLRWNNYQSNLTSVFDQLLQNESFVDVTLACDGRSIKAHKMVLSACSPYFQMLFSDTPCQHPIVIMRDVSWADLKAIVEFMYKGEINVSQEQIGPLLRIAEMLKVRGLADVNGVGATSSLDMDADCAPSERSDKMETKMTATSPKQRRQSLSSPEGQKADSDQLERESFLASFIEPEKKLRWGDFSSTGASSSNMSVAPNNNLELRLSPPLLHQQHPFHHQQQQQAVARNVRKRRWPSSDTIFNPPASPLSGLIAAERAERERERERDRERERAHDRPLLTPPIPTSSGGGAATNISARLTPSSVIDADAPISIPSPSPTPLPSTRASTGALTPSPHQQQTSLHHAHHHQHSHHSSPASSTASNTPHHHPSSVISNPLTPSPASGGPSTAHGEGRFPLGHAQAAAMAAAAAAAQMDSMGLSGMGMSHHHPPPIPPIPPSASAQTHHHTSSIVDDLEIKPGIAEMIREEERAKMLENSHSWMGASTSSIADSYQYQLQSMWQKCWNTNQNLMHHLRFRERGPLKSWRPETMAEAIFSVLKEGLSLSQAARKYDIPYPTFVLYANRVHNMLGPSIDGGPDLRPKGRGRPQRILLGIWPDEHIKGVIKTVVFRDAKDLKDEGLSHLQYGRHSPVFPFQEGHLNYPGVSGMGGPVGPCPNGMPTPTGDQMSQEATAAAVAAVAHNLRQQMQMAAAAQHQHQHPEVPSAGANLFNLPPHLQPHLAAAAAGGGAPGPGGPLPGPGPGGISLPKPSISPASSSTSNSASTMLGGPRHVQSPCGPVMPGLPNLPPGMAAALHMASSGSSGPLGRGAEGGPTAAMLSQQQQHQLQQLHLQQQHVLHQHQQHQHQQHSPAHMAFHSSALASTSAAAAAAAAAQSTAALHRHQQHQQQQQQQQTSSSSAHHPSTVTASQETSSNKQKSIMPSSPHRRRSSPIDTPSLLHSPLTELGLGVADSSGMTVGVSGMTYKPSRGYSSPRPEHLFQEDIADLVGGVIGIDSGTSGDGGGAVSGPGSGDTTVTSAVATTATTLPTTSTATGGTSSSSSNIKIELVTTSSE